MTSWFRRVVAVAVVAAAASGDVSGQEFQYEWADKDGQAVTAVTIPGVGGTVEVRIYLRADEDGIGLITGNGGLLTAAVRVSGYGGVLAGPDPENGAIAADNVVGGPWAFGNANDAPPSGLSLAVGSTLTEGVLLDGGRVWIGTFTLIAAGVGGTTLTAGDPNPENDGDLFTFGFPDIGQDGTAIDRYGISGAPLTVTVSVTPVPEPAGLLLAGGVLVTAVRRVRTRASSGS
jgi:hypothetical protein